MLITSQITLFLHDVINEGENVHNSFIHVHYTYIFIYYVDCLKFDVHSPILFFWKTKRTGFSQAKLDLTLTSFTFVKSVSLEKKMKM